MSEISRHLPLSQRSTGDEAAATRDWRPLIGESLHLVGDVLSGLPAADWEKPSLCEGWRIRDVAGHLVWRVGTSTPDLAKSSVRAMVRDGVRPSRLIDVMSARAVVAEPAELVAELRAIADARIAHTGRRNLTELTEVIVHGYDIAHALGMPLAFSPTATGAVVLARTLAAPIRIKAVVRGRTLASTDAGWSVGRGPELASTAESLILFLFGRSAAVPRSGG